MPTVVNSFTTHCPEIVNGRDTCGNFQCRYCYYLVGGVRVTSTNRFVTRCPETGYLRMRCQHGCHHCCDDDDCIECENCGHINDDCECEWCDYCSNKVSSRCSRCERCSDCCECYYCSSCDEQYESVCEDCEHCESCCNCSEIGDDRSVYQNRTKIWKGEGRLVGLEVEYTRSDNFVPIEEWADKWYASVHSDGSCGWECVTAPSSGDYLERQIKELSRALKEANAKHDRECGVHVHVDARDLRAQDIRRLARLYVALEPMLYVIGGDFRVGTHYCAPNGQKLHTRMYASGHKNWVYGLLSGIYTGAGSGLNKYLKTKPDKKDQHRYAGLNLCPWVAGRITHASDTTIEFRMHRDCHDSTRLLNWSRLCASIVDFANHHTDSDIDEIIHVDSARLAMYIAPSLSGWILSRIKSWHSDINSRSNVIYKNKKWIFRRADYNA